MRFSLFTLLLIGYYTVCSAQKLEMELNKINPIILHNSHVDSVRKYFTNSFYSEEGSFSKQDNLVFSVFYSNKLAVNYDHALLKIPQLKAFGNIKPHQTTFRALKSYGGEYAIPIFDSTGIIVTINGINPENAGRYEFRVMENKTKVVLPWSKPKLFTHFFWATKIADSTKNDDLIAYLGQFKAAYGNALTFQIRKTSRPDSIKTSISAYWVKWHPKVVGVFTFAELPNFLSLFKEQWGEPVNYGERPDWSKNLKLLKLKSNFESNENNLIFYLDDIIKSKDVIEYEVVKDGEHTGWNTNDFDFNLIWLKNLSPGKYKLHIRYSVQRKHVFSYPFIIQAAWYQTIWTKAAISILVILAIGFLILLWRSGKQATELKEQGILKQVVQTELKSIRSQFNPHFVFNALSSIQGLITKNDAGNASKYLIEFSNLMRASLKASENEFVSVVTEVEILNNYLSLEKLRFGFQYNIIVRENIDVSATEIPSLLLQPLVENAVKHGISSLQEQGILEVSFEKTGNDMTVRITDNGKGFDENHSSHGFGLQLTKERIKLLNQTLNGQRLELSIGRINSQTQVTILFQNWFI
jgi:two-component system LytT family sensor kinase